MIRKCYIYLLLSLIFLTLFAYGLDPLLKPKQFPSKQVETKITGFIKDWEVPGVAIAIIHKDKLLFSRCYGVQTVAKETPIDSETLFAIGSLTKAFTSYSLGLLVKEGRLAFDIPISQYHPGIPWSSTELKEKVTLRDLLAHRTGLVNAQDLWFQKSISKKALIEEFAKIPPKTTLRDTFIYNNITYMIAGELIPHVTHMSWDQFVEKNILRPLEMQRTFTSVKEAEKESNIASPHRHLKEGVQSIAREDNDSVGPGGSIYSNLEDMSKWVSFLLSSKEFIATDEALKELWEPQMAIGLDTFIAKGFPFTKSLSYGLGWFLYDYKDHQLIEHSGTTDGMQALLTLIPEEDIGIIILTNSYNLGLPTVIKYTLLDELFNVPLSVDWNRYALGEVKKLRRE